MEKHKFLKTLHFFIDKNHMAKKQFAEMSPLTTENHHLKNTWVIKNIMYDYEREKNYKS